jgi:hypothetical protein
MGPGAGVGLFDLVLGPGVVDVDFISAQAVDGDKAEVIKVFGAGLEVAQDGLAGLRTGVGGGFLKKCVGVQVEFFGAVEDTAHLNHVVAVVLVGCQGKSQGGQPDVMRIAVANGLDAIGWKQQVAGREPGAQKRLMVRRCAVIEV